ncbi:MAG TPA: sulfotransferase [Candidatus Sulfotelmatobacter sp.]
MGSIPGIEPVFVVGAGRSGTTPLQLALNMHPELGVYGETQAFFEYRRFGPPANEVNFRSLLDHWRGVLSECCPYNDLLENREIQSQLADAPSYAHILNILMGAIAAREGKSRWGEKTPAHILKLPEIRACFPNAGIIHIVRDPRAVVCSTIKAFNRGQFTDWNVYSAAHHWLRCLEVHARQESRKESENSDRYMLVRYEDFVTQPEESLNGICSFLGITFVRAMLKAHQVASDYVRPRRCGGKPDLHVLTRKPLDSGRTDAWRGILSPAQSKLIEQVAGRQMAGLGYEPAHEGESHAPLRVSYFSMRSAVWVSGEVLMNQIKIPYWAVRRVIDSRNASKGSDDAQNGATPVVNSTLSVKQKRMG